MTPATAAELAMTGSFVLFAVLAWLYLWPWVCEVGAQRALPPLLAVHVFRHVALQLVSANAFGLPISTAGRDQIVYGDLAGMVLALAALVATARHWSVARLLTWVFVTETALDLGNSLVVGLRESLFDYAQNLSWLIVTFYVPLLWVTLAAVIGVLVMSPSAGRAPAPAR